MEKPDYLAVSLFSGAMGLDHGLQSTGRFRIAACVEHEKTFCETIRANVGQAPDAPRIYETDIRELDPRRLMSDLGLVPGQVDLLLGGPPCQSFSTAGKRGTVQDPRGTLLWEFLRFVDALRPKFFLMENVRGLLSAALRHRPIAQRPDRGGPPLLPEEGPGSVVHLFAADLQELAGSPYVMDCFEVNAVNYGAPQLRERALFVGNRYGLDLEFPDPTHGAAGEPAPPTLFGPSGLGPWRTLGDALRGLDEDAPVIMDFSPRKKKYLSLVPPGGNWRHLPLELQRESMGRAFHAKGGRSGWWRRLSYDLPCPTLVTMPNHAGTALCHPEEVRALTVGEYCRVQEFPDDWVVCGTPAEQYRQIGNAVPVRLGQVAGTVLAAALDRLVEKGEPATTGAKRPFRRVYIQSHVRTRSWFRDGEALCWSDGEDNHRVSYSPMKTKRAWRVLEPGEPYVSKP